MKLQVLSHKPETSVVLQQQVRKSKEVDAMFILAALHSGCRGGVEINLGAVL